MSKKLLGILIIVLIVLSPIAYLVYGYVNYPKIIVPKGSVPSQTYLVFKFSNGTYLSLTPEEYFNLTHHGFKLPPGTEAYVINVTGQITGFPNVDLNLTLMSHYDKFTIVIGSPVVKMCSSNPENFPGNCAERTAAVTEISALVANLFKRYYYWKALQEGMDNASAKAYAYKETLMRYDIRYLTFLTKALIGSGRLGNKNHLAVVLMGPAEGAELNRIFMPRVGLIILEGKTDSTLRAEVALIEHIIGFKWPENQTATG